MRQPLCDLAINVYVDMPDAHLRTVHANPGDISVTRIIPVNVMLTLAEVTRRLMGFWQTVGVV